MAFIKPGRKCSLCPRLATFRDANHTRFPAWHNAPVPSFGSKVAWLLVIGLAPGLRGANRTGRPFTGDFAGELLYTTLIDFGLAAGIYRADPEDGLCLQGCRITNAVRCVPPENRPLPEEARQCRFFLSAEIAAMPRLQAIVALGRVAHESTLAARGLKKATSPFHHGALYQLAGGVLLADSYHCSRYNTQTGRLTETMFRGVFQQVMDAVATK